MLQQHPLQAKMPALTWCISRRYCDHVITYIIERERKKLTTIHTPHYDKQNIYFTAQVKRAISQWSRPICFYFTTNNTNKYLICSVDPMQTKMSNNCLKKTISNGHRNIYLWAHYYFACISTTYLLDLQYIGHENKGSICIVIMWSLRNVHSGACLADWTLIWFLSQFSSSFNISVHSDHSNTYIDSQPKAISQCKNSWQYTKYCCTVLYWRNAIISQEHQLKEAVETRDQGKPQNGHV